MAAIHDEAMQRVKDAIDADPTLPHTVADLARLAHFGHFHFQRLFSARYGITAGWYVRKARMRLACHLIETTDWNMARITRETGYTSQPAFWHIFRRVIGCPPTAYRKWVHHATELNAATNSSKPGQRQREDRAC